MMHTKANALLLCLSIRLKQKQGHGVIRRKTMVRIVHRNDDPPSGDTATEALFDDIYDQFPDDMDEALKEELSVWIADTVQKAYSDGYNQGVADSREALEQGYTP
jgi:hypothetical protein